MFDKSQHVFDGIADCFLFIVSLRRVHNRWQPSAVKGLLMMAEKSDKEDFSFKINILSI